MKQGQLKTAPHCPKCNKLLDGFTSAEGGTPKAGDISVCVYCWEILEFTDNMELKIATADTIAKCDFPKLQQANKLIRALANVRRDG